MEIMVEKNNLGRQALYRSVDRSKTRRHRLKKKRFERWGSLRRILYEIGRNGRNTKGDYY